MSLISLLLLLFASYEPNIELRNDSVNSFHTKVYLDGHLIEFVMKPKTVVTYKITDNILIHSKRLTNNCDSKDLYPDYGDNNSFVINGWCVYQRHAPAKGYLLEIIFPFNICRA